MYFLISVTLSHIPFYFTLGSINSSHFTNGKMKRGAEVG